MRFGSTAKVLLKCKLKYYKISECVPGMLLSSSSSEVIIAGHLDTSIPITVHMLLHRQTLQSFMYPVQCFKGVNVVVLHIRPRSCCRSLTHKIIKQ